jgi:hypothetical protein
MSRINKIKKRGEIISQILVNNEYPLQIKKKIKQKSSKIEPQTIQKGKWVTFAYFGPCVKTITLLFRNTDLKVAFETKNTIKYHIRATDKTTDVSNLSGFYQMIL